MQFSITRRDIRAMMNLTADKDIRYYLCGLHIVQDIRGTIIEATDGHILGAMLIDNNPQPEGRVILGNDYLKKLAGTKREQDQVIEFSVTGGSITAAVQGSVMTFNAIDGKFPDCPRVIPTNAVLQTAPVETAQFNPELVSRFADVSKALGHKGFVWIRHNGDRPAIVSIDHDSFIGVIMPMRGEAPTEVPSWVHAPQKAQQTEAVAA